MQNRTNFQISKPYSFAKINEWEKKLDTIPSLILAQKQLIAKHENENKLSAQALKEIQERIAPIDQAIRGLDARIEILNLENELVNKRNDVKKHEKEVEVLTPKLNDVIKKLNPINAQIERLNRLIAIKDMRSLLNTHTEIHSKNAAKISNLYAQLSDKARQAEEVHHRMQSLQTDISNLELRQTLDQAQHHHHHHHHHDHHHHDHHHHDDHHHHHSGWDTLFDVVHAAGDVSVSWDLSSKRTALADLTVQDRTLHAEKSAIHNAIMDLERQVESAHRQIQQLQVQLNSFTTEEKNTADSATDHGLRNELNAQMTLKNPLQLQSNDLQAKIHNEQTIILSGNLSISNAETRVRVLTPYAAPYMMQINIADLKTQLTERRNARIPYANDEHQTLSNINLHNQSINQEREKKSQLELLEKNMRQNNFLVTLHERPLLLVKELAEKIDDTFKHFEKLYPIKQSSAVRICLTEYLKKINTIQTSEDPMQPGSAQIEGDANSQIDKAAVQLKFFRLCGLLSAMRAKLSWDDEDRHFANEINNILRDYPILEEDTLAEFRRFQLTQPQLSFIDIRELNRIENERYESVQNQLSNALNAIPSDMEEFKHLREAGFAVLNGIISEESKYDIKFRTTLLKKTVELLNNPRDKAIQTNYQAFATHVQDGKPSFCKKLFGLLCSFLGAAIVVSGMAAKIATLGVATPISASGIACGAALFLVGVGLFKSGMHKGLSKKLATFNHTASHSNIPDRIYQAAEPLVQTEVNAPRAFAPLATEDVSASLARPSAPPL